MTTKPQDRRITLPLTPIEAGWLADALVNITGRKSKNITGDRIRDLGVATGIEEKLMPLIAKFCIMVVDGTEEH